YELFWILDDIGDAEALVAKNGSGINTVADLKGKKIALPFNSTTHFHLMVALEQAKVNPADVQILNMRPPEVRAAWARGDIQAPSRRTCRPAWRSIGSRRRRISRPNGSAAARTAWQPRRSPRPPISRCRRSRSKRSFPITPSSSTRRTRQRRLSDALVQERDA